MSDYDAMIRWQAYARDSRSSVNSHYLTYATAILGIQASYLMSNEISTIPCPWSYSISGSLASASLVAGSLVVLLRLEDARRTARLARFRYTNKSKSEISTLRNSVNNYSRWVNRLLPLQVILFASSAIGFLIWVIGSNLNKFPF